jgi:hypothetical protein
LLSRVDQVQLWQTPQRVKTDHSGRPPQENPTGQTASRFCNRHCGSIRSSEQTGKEADKVPVEEVASFNGFLLAELAPQFNLLAAQINAVPRVRKSPPAKNRAVPLAAESYEVQGSLRAVQKAAGCRTLTPRKVRTSSCIIQASKTTLARSHRTGLEITEIREFAERAENLDFENARLNLKFTSRSSIASEKGQICLVDESALATSLSLKEVEVN